MFCASSVSFHEDTPYNAIGPRTLSKSLRREVKSDLLFVRPDILAMSAVQTRQMRCSHYVSMSGDSPSILPENLTA
eukprot:2377539-Pyramimonas_sp.AAC.1